MAQALYRKWRPRTFQEIVGQEHVVRTLHNALATGRVHHAYLFAGPRGTGKTTTARLLAKAVNCEAPDPANRPCNECTICEAVNNGRLMDLIEIDAASNTGVDDVRELRERVGFRPSVARYKVYVIDEVHMLSNAAFNALLKTLEEPPPHAIFVLATTEPHKILPTILSRCQRLDFRRIPLSAIVGRLEKIAEQEEIQADHAALTLVARQATGSMRDAESLLDQLAAYNAGGITVEEVRAALGTGSEEAVADLAAALAEGDVARGLTIINAAADQGTDPRQFARQVVQHLRALLLTRMGSQEVPLHVPDELEETFRSQAAAFDPHDLARAVRLFSEAASEARAAWQPQLPLELAFVEAALPMKDAEPPAKKAAASSAPHSAPRKKRRSPRTRDTVEPLGSASPAAPAEPATGASPPSGELSLPQVQKRWDDLLGAIRSRNLQLEALLRSGEPVRTEKNTVFISFSYDFHKGKVAEEGNRRIVEEALEQLLGQKVRIRCQLAKSSQLAQQSSPSQQAETEASATNDGLIRDAVEKLGARVVDNS
ncbi:MAG: DNA polymerase III subunit gamma/tau [Anaerolineae bacterium]|jgi:DNA polymerase-3 subunit gamma/tau